MPAQIDVIRRHIDDALARGGRAVLGGAGRGAAAVRAADDPGRRAGGRRGGARGDVRADADGHPGRATPTRRSRGPTPCRTGWAARSSAGARAAAICPAAALRHDRGQLGALLRRHAERCRSAASATPASAASTATTGCASSPGPSRSRRAGRRRLLPATTFRR